MNIALKIGSCLALIGYAMFSVIAFAGTSDIKAANNQIGSLVIATNVDYVETGNGTFGTKEGVLDTSTGWLTGSRIFVSTMNDWWLGNDYIAAEYDYAVGNLHYKGSTAEAGAVYGSIEQPVYAKQINFSSRYGKGFVVNEESMLTPYIEIAYHEWRRMINYGETYHHKYWGVGALAQYSPVKRLVYSVRALLGRSYASGITVDSGPEIEGFSEELGNATMYKVGAYVDYAFTTNMSGRIGIDYSYFEYGISKPHFQSNGTYIWEPDSKSNNMTIKFGMGYTY